MQLSAHPQFGKSRDGNLYTRLDNGALYRLAPVRHTARRKLGPRGLRRFQERLKTHWRVFKSH